MSSATPRRGPNLSRLALRVLVLGVVAVAALAVLQAQPPGRLRPADQSVGVPTAPPPRKVDGVARAVPGLTQVSAGGDYSCGLGSGRIECWGRNVWGQVGTGRKSGPVTSPQQVGGWADWKQVTAGGATTCGIRTTARTLYCWGLDNKGQLGNGKTAVSLTPTRAPGKDWRTVSLSWFHGCGIRGVGQLLCWGDNSYGELGRGNTRTAPKMEALPGKWLSVSTQGWSTCGIKADHSLWCWGRNVLGGLGTGSYATRTKPTHIGGNTRWRDVALSWTHACGVHEDKSVWCWGRNDVGGVGDGTTTTRNRPTRVAGGLRARSVSAFEGGACAVSAAGPTYCWGDNHYGQVGGSKNYYTKPRRRAGSYQRLSSGWFHTCAVGAKVTCWGADDQDQLSARPLPRTKGRPLTQAQRDERARQPISFRIATYNALEEAHTGPYHDADGYAPTRLRNEWVVRTMINQGLDVIGMQETSTEQVSQILRAAGRSRLAAFPDPAKDKVYPETSIFWNPQKFALVKTGTIRTMFRDKPLPRPFVKLRDRRTGRELWVMSIHNAGWNRPEKRKVAERAQLAKIAHLQQSAPVFYVGDFNEKQPAVCRVLKQSTLSSATGGHVTASGKCVPPQHMRIDWLFGPSTTQWSGYQYSRQPMVRLTTDHGVASASVRVP
ncbi:MAG: hypothetical protein FWE71_11505 [Nocardioidaceae bacterium]|nr:hypothetical protein [Nocardioidaceae bacterium]MCL2613077.1 hypothetical protein [Nocardioidaceae bacterium]